MSRQRFACSSRGTAPTSCHEARRISRALEHGPRSRIVGALAVQSYPRPFDEPCEERVDGRTPRKRLLGLMLQPKAESMSNTTVSEHIGCTTRSSEWRRRSPSWAATS
jgi:hypothetical protein